MLAGLTLLACTICDTGTGQALRTGILDGDLVRNLAAVLLPFALMSGVIALAWFGGKGRRDG